MADKIRQNWCQIDADRLRSVMDKQGWNPTTLARRMSWDRPAEEAERQQTIQALGSRVGIVRCQADRLHRLAQVLLVPDEWLQGSDAPILVPPFSPELLASRRTSLAVARLMSQCLAAARRDYEPPEDDAASPVLEFQPGDSAIWFVMSALSHLVSPWTWRARLTTGPASQPNEADVPVPRSAADLTEGLSRPTPLTREHEDLIIGLVRVFEYALQPWIEGVGELDTRSFAWLAKAVNPMVGEMIPEGWEEPRAEPKTPGDLAYERFADPHWNLAPRRRKREDSEE